MENYMKLTIPSHSQNEGFARAAVGAFAAGLDPTLEELEDIKTAVSEAVTNAIVHGYENTVGQVEIDCSLIGNTVHVTITDEGKGIEDIALAMQPLYSGSDDEERSGMGFTVMESFMDTLSVESTPQKGTVVSMTKHIEKNAYV